MSSEDLSKDDDKDEIDGPFNTLPLDSSEFIYDMRHPKRGKFIIINNRTFQPATGMNERTGTDADAYNLYNIFSKFGFEVSLFNNLTKDAMLQEMLAAAQEDHTDRDCFGVAVLSHGDEDVLYGTDSVIAIDNFVCPIKSCKSLVGKPKLFFFQACRGNELDSGMLLQSDLPDDNDSKMPSLVIPMEADFLYAYSTVPGYFSWRNSSKGSWFVQALTQTLSKPESEKMEFVRIMTRVNHAVSHQFESNASSPEMNKKKQVPSIVSMLTKDLYLGPKV